MLLRVRFVQTMFIFSGLLSVVGRFCAHLLHLRNDCSLYDFKPLRNKVLFSAADVINRSQVMPDAH